MSSTGFRSCPSLSLLDSQLTRAQVPVPSVSCSPVCVLSTAWTSSGHPSSSQSEVLKPLGAAPERDPGVSRAASQAGKPPSSASFWSFYPTFPEFLLSSCPDLQHHVFGCAVRAAMPELRPLGWVTVWSASPRRSLAGFLLSLSRVCCPLCAVCQARVAAPRGDPGGSGTQRGRPPPGSETGSPPISELSLICTSCWLSARTCYEK